MASSKSSKSLIAGRNTLGAMQATAQSSAAAAHAVNPLMGLSSNLPRILDVPLTKIERNPDQPRKVFNAGSIESLAESIDRYGLKSPVLVRPADNGNFQLVAGERRLRACEKLGRTSIAAIISADDVEETALVENAQREDLNPVDIAFALHKLSDRYTHADLGKIANLHRTIVSKLLKIVHLPDAMIEEYKALALAEEPQVISRTTMIQIAAADTGDEQWRLWEEAKAGSTTREVEESRRDDTSSTEASSEPGVQTQDAAATSARPAPDLRRTIANTVKRLEKDVAVITTHARTLSGNERARLETLRRQIDEALSAE